MIHSGRHFLQIPGPTNIPDRVLRAMDHPVIDHRSAEFSKMTLEVLEYLGLIFKTRGPIIIYPASGTGAWEAAITNTLSAGDRVLMFETGHFAFQWRRLVEKFGIQVEYVPGDWRRGVAAADVEALLGSDERHTFKAVMVVHNETSTGVTSNVLGIRKAIDRAKHPALLMVDTISSLGSMEYKHDDWAVDVTVAGSQKGLMLPAGLSFNAVSEKALSASKTARLPRSYWDWEDMITSNRNGAFPYTPATTLLYGLRESLVMLQEEGLVNVFARHDRHAEATRTAVRAWGLEIVCENPREYSSSLTAVYTPDGHNADDLRKVIVETFDMSLGAGLSKLTGKVFRIGHLGHFNDLMLAGTLCGVEMGLQLANVPYNAGGTTAALKYLADVAQESIAKTSD